MKTGGAAAFFAEPSSEEEIIGLINFAKENSLPYFVLGNGSNVIADDDGYDGLVILTDGYAPEPIIPAHFKPPSLWVCESNEAYRQHEHWMRKSGRVCTMRLR